MPRNHTPVNCTHLWGKDCRGGWGHNVWCPVFLYWDLQWGDQVIIFSFKMIIYWDHESRSPISRSTMRWFHLSFKMIIYRDHASRSPILRSTVRQCVTIPKFRTKPDSETFSDTKFFRYRVRYFFKTKFFRYRIRKQLLFELRRKNHLKHIWAKKKIYFHSLVNIYRSSTITKNYQHLLFSFLSCTYVQ